MDNKDAVQSAKLLAKMNQGSFAEVYRSYLMNNYGPPKARFVSGSQSTLVDEDGHEVLDFLGGIAVCSLGHAPPQVAKAISEQAQKLIHTSNFFANEHGPKVAFLIDSLINSARGTGKTFFCNSGAEANEAAIKLARRVKGSQARRIVALNGGFHGRTMGALSATGQPAKREPFEPLLAGFSHVEPGDLKGLEAELSIGGVAAVMVEPILGEAGVLPLPDGFLAGTRQLCDRFDALLIVDEIQTGFGRTGQWFGFQHVGVEPDMVTMAKAIASGFPVGALWARSDLADHFVPGDHGTTFGGQALAMAAALATITSMIDLDVCGLAREKGQYLSDALTKIPGVTEVRGQGLLIGASLERPIAQGVATEALALGLIVNAIGDSTLRFAPPLIVSEAEIDSACAILTKVLAH